MTVSRRIGHLVVLTGFSGAGISSSLKYLQDIGYYWMDNPPLAMIPSLMDHCIQTQETLEGFAIGFHWRDYGKISLFQESLTALGLYSERLEIVFLEADADILVSRYRETRRSHPMAQDRTVHEAVTKEIETLQPVRAMANLILDTSRTTVPELKERLHQHFKKNNDNDLVIVLRSFGFKFGMNTDADMVLDARFLPNPYYEPTLRNATGLDAGVQNFLEEDGDAMVFLAHLTDFFTYLLPKYQKEKKRYFTVDIGCTGGHHRSVFLVERLTQILRAKGWLVLSRHRELER